MDKFYNNDRKLIFINFLIENGKNTYKMYNKIFFVTAKFEKLFGKDLSSFASNELMIIYKSIAENVKYTTVTTYNSIIGDYKEWCEENGYDFIKEICTTTQMKTIKNYKQYTILNDEDIIELTGDDKHFIEIDGADYNAVIFMRLFWEIDAKEKPENILKITIDDLDVEKSTIIINTKEYSISNYLSRLIYEFANLQFLVFRVEGKNGAKSEGNYRILSANENSGYIFRTAYTKRTVIGEPLTTSRLSNLLYKFCERYNMDDTINTNDLLMSLALKHMLVHKLTHVDMYNAGVTDRKTKIKKNFYFSNIPSSVYKTVFEKYAKNKFPELYRAFYDKYIELKREHESNGGSTVKFDKDDYEEREKELINDFPNLVNEKQEVRISRVKRYQSVVKNLKKKYNS